MAGARIRLLLADDHTLLRQGLRAILEKEADIRIVAEAQDGREVVRKAVGLKPDVIVMDISMPRFTGIEATEQLRLELPCTKVVALSMHDGDEQVEAVLSAGACGYVLKDSPAPELLAAIRTVHSGGVYLSPRISASIVRKFLAGRPPRPCTPGDRPVPVLTEREQQVLRAIHGGRTNREIAQSLEVAVKTVESHRATLMKKLAVHNAAQLIREAVQLDLLRPR